MTATPGASNWASSKRREHVKITLRPPQVAHLRYIAKWDECSVTRAFTTLLERHAPSGGLLLVHGGPTLRTHFALQATHLAMLDALARQWGMQRGEVVRRVIDMAMAEETRSVGVPVRAGD